MLDAVHFGFLLYRTKSEWFLVPENEKSDEIIVIDCVQLTLRKQPVSTVIPSDATVDTVQLFLGTIRLLTGMYLIISNDCQPAIEILDNRVFEVKKLQFLRINEPISRKDDPNKLADDRFLQMLREGSATQNFYCSRTWDLSRPVQENFAKPQNGRNLYSVDPEFVWNWAAMSDTLSSCKGLENFLMPIINGYAAEYKRDIHYILLSRRSRFRAGLRYYRRGIDDQGHVANFVQTEQIICTSDSKIYSFVQLRGSIPVYWSQKPNLMYKPQPCIQKKNHETAFELHFRSLARRYGHVTIVSLIDHHGSESALSHLYRNLCSKYPDLVYREYDFHYHSGQNDQSFSILMNMVADPLKSAGQCIVDANTGTILKKQNGIIRTNCMDSLDRTNVVQSMIAKAVLEKQLAEIYKSNVPSHLLNSLSMAKLIRQDGTMNLAESDAYLNQAFLDAWAGNADTLSLQYTGTPAMKTDYTRTGKRTMEGRLNDGYNSLLRYVYNNFADGYRQDSIDLLVGNYVVGREPLSTTVSRTARSPDLRLLALPVLTVFSMFMLMVTVSNTIAPPRDRIINILFWASALGTTICGTLLCGESIVDTPNLLPVD